MNLSEWVVDLSLSRTTPRTFGCHPSLSHFHTFLLTFFDIRLNRFSMPVNSNRHPRLSAPGTSTGNTFGLANTTSFLFDEDDDKHPSLQAIDLKSPVAKAFAQLEGDDTFPTLTSDGLKVCL